MRLEDVTAEIRPRVPWESIDLGCALARRHIGTIWKSWMVTVVPLWLLLGLVLINHPVWFMLITWWLKPVYDRVPLLVVSRALFGAVPSVREVLKLWPKLILRNAWFALVLGRFSPARGLSMPVAELEGLRGADYRKRVNLLARNGGEGATLATLAGLLLELVVGAGIILLVFLMLPAHVSTEWQQEIGEAFAHDEYNELAGGLLWLIALVRIVSYTLMEPFYVSAGFALYVNSRTLTEGWDIELAFKRLGSRLEAVKKGAGAAMLTLSVVMMTFAMSVPQLNAQHQHHPREQINEILQHEDFTIHHRLEDVPVGETDSSGSLPNVQVPPLFADILFIVILIMLAAGLAYLIYVNRHVFTGQGDGGSSGQGAKTREVMGMEVSPESLPDDVVAAAREAWQQGECQLALSYLYRGSIAWFVHRADLPISEGDTEGDCLRHVGSMQNQSLDRYFSELTSSWVGVAYGDQKPEDQVMNRLCDTWPFGLSERSAR